MTTDTLTIDERERWVLFGARWRVVELSDEHAAVDPCTSAGGPLERRESDDPALIGYLRSTTWT